MSKSVINHICLSVANFCSIALFSSELKGRLFVPNAEEKKCIVISSTTGKLIDTPVEAVLNAMQIFNESLALA